MTERFEDDALERRFAEMREDESGNTPEFDAVLARALARRRAPDRSSHRVLAAAATLVLALGLGWAAARSRGRSSALPDATSVAAISQWRSPTAFLLDGPSDALLRTVPAITAMPPELRSVLPADTNPNGGPS
jgi:hypothetical protein